MSAPHDDYKRLATPVGSKLHACPVCGSEAELWQYSESEKSETQKVVCCTLADPFGPQDGLIGEGCLLYMPPQLFYRATMRDAIRYWNDYAAALEKLRRAKHWETAQVLRTHAAPAPQAQSEPAGGVTGASTE